jgi:hypothetical protein
MSENLFADPVLRRIRTSLRAIYGDRLERLVLFGSRARRRASGFRLRRRGLSQRYDRSLARVPPSGGPQNRYPCRDRGVYGGATVPGGLLPRPHPADARDPPRRRRSMKSESAQYLNRPGRNRAARRSYLRNGGLRNLRQSIRRVAGGKLTLAQQRISPIRLATTRIVVVRRSARRHLQPTWKFAKEGSDRHSAAWATAASLRRQVASSCQLSASMNSAQRR